MVAFRLTSASTAISPKIISGPQVRQVLVRAVDLLQHFALALFDDVDVVSQVAPD